ncbi:hypothetical protein V6N12_045192 [Hibiscus sabdariffa]|uniref:Uncharacterized protein n=1 Tax=Hibiscus sabdariffa TaxID=183260 RepID=A0ABR2G211_9ROSI
MLNPSFESISLSPIERPLFGAAMTQISRDALPIGSKLRDANLAPGTCPICLNGLKTVLHVLMTVMPPTKPSFLWVCLELSFTVMHNPPLLG